MKITYSTDELDDYRQTIDHLDSSLLFLLSERCHVISKIAAIKKSENLSAQYSIERKADLKRTMRFAIKHQLNKVFLNELFSCIFHHAKNSIESVPRQTKRETAEDLSELRKSLMHLDLALCIVLAERFHTSLKIAEYKLRNNLPMLDSQRWHALMQMKLNIAEKLGIQAALVEDIFNIIHEESLRLQKAAHQIITE